MKRQQGSALIMVLVVVVVLSTLVLSFAGEMKVVTLAQGATYDSALCYELAQSAVEIARLEINDPRRQLYVRDENRCYFVRRGLELEEQFEALEQHRQGLPLGRGRISYAVIRPRGGLGINSLTPPQFHRLLEVAAAMEMGAERSALVMSFFDWKDADNLTRPEGAEEEYYQELDPPRHCRNGPLQSNEELSLIRGFTPELLYGSTDTPVTIEGGMEWGGGIFRYLRGATHAEAIASRTYILTGKAPTDAFIDAWEEEEEEDYLAEKKRPDRLHLIAMGWIPADQEEEEEELEEFPPLGGTRAMARHRIHVILQKNPNGTYRIVSWLDSLSETECREILGVNRQRPEE